MISRHTSGRSFPCRQKDVSMRHFPRPSALNFRNNSREHTMADADIKNSEFANTAEVSPEDAPTLDSPTGREDHLGMPEAARVAAGEIKKPIGAHPMSEVTGRHDAGSGANETEDGLDSYAEAIRHGAEDIPTGASERDEDIPVFDRADQLPKV
jgi:hypothetical protein